MSFFNVLFCFLCNTFFSFSDDAYESQTAIHYFTFLFFCCPCNYAPNFLFSILNIFFLFGIFSLFFFSCCICVAYSGNVLIPLHCFHFILFFKEITIYTIFFRSIFVLIMTSLSLISKSYLDFFFFLTLSSTATHSFGCHSTK